MNHDEKVLKYIAKDENISQRQLAKYTDLSLGNLNLVLHKLVEKGLVKIEQINPRSLRYILTPQGIARNTKRTYNYIQNAVKLVLEMDRKIKSIYSEYVEKGYTIYIDGEEDEIYKMLKQITNDKSLVGIKWIEAENDKIKDLKPLVLVWQQEQEEKYKNKNIEYIYLPEIVEN